jgi:urea transport system permease protein
MVARVASLVMMILGVVVLTLAQPHAESADLNELVQRLGSGSFADKLEAVGVLAATGDERAVAVLEAMLEGKLQFRSESGQVVIAEQSGAAFILRDPLSLAEIAQVDRAAFEPVTVNNRLRGALRGALGGLTLLSEDPARRAAAADAVFRTRDRELLPIMEKALKRETEERVRLRLERAVAATRATAPLDGTARMAAVRELGRFADPDVRSLLASLSATDPDPDVSKAAAVALAGVEQRLALWSVAGNLFQGISLGSVLLLAAVGLAITFGVMGVINMAHGEMVMLGAYTTFVVQEVFRDHWPERFDYSLLVALPAAFAVAGLAGIAIERTIIRFLYGRPLETLLATWGLSLILQQTVRTVFGPSNREVGNPSWMSGALELTGALVLTYNRIWIIVFSLVVLGLLVVLINRSSFGLRMRAVTQNRRMAASMGIRTSRIDALTFGLGSGIAGIAGVALSQIDNVSPNLGQSYIIDSFMVVVFGGVGNLWGTLVGAMSLGLINKFLEPYAGAVLGKILVLVAIILFIQKRPRGLFALKGRAVES